jgi:spermidine synthase
MNECAAGARIIVGDGRLKLKLEPDGKYDLIVLDAFSSDSIPVHMITVEAVDLYLSKLKPGGVILFHISNRFMELSSVVEAASRARGLVAYHNAMDLNLWRPDKSRFDLMSQVAVVTRSAETLGALASDPAWHRGVAAGLPPPWADDYSNILGAIWRKSFGASVLPAR